MISMWFSTLTEVWFCCVYKKMEKKSYNHRRMRKEKLGARVGKEQFGEGDIWEGKGEEKRRERQ